MSIEVAAGELAEAVKGYAVAYLLTLGDRPRPHIGAVSTTVADGVVRVRGMGRTALSDVGDHDAVTVLWAPPEPSGYSLIVDGTATIVGDRLDVVPVRAVLHRPAPAPEPNGSPCAADCVELSVEPPGDA